MKKETCDAAGEFGMCPFVTAQQLISGKWAILILHVLADGPKRFNRIQREIDVTQATLTTHLKRLEEYGLVKRTVFPEIPPRVEYELTQIGSEFRPVLDQVETWGNKYIAYLKQQRASDLSTPAAATAR
ncbi:MAG: helix-turn-helix transcriptional regulator [Coriobacteriaceae bacterium]|nr:helix-turn-helix transcriptional regulator [Coriobacteriaceae bacterium]